MPSVLSIFADESGTASRWLTMDFLMSLSMLGRCLPGMMLTKG